MKSRAIVGFEHHREFLYGDVASSQGTVAEQSGSFGGNAHENANRTGRRDANVTDRLPLPF